MQQYTLTLVSLLLVLVMMGCDDFENEPLKAGSKQTSQSTPSIQAALIEPARTPLDGDVTITINVTELPDRTVRIHGTTNLPTGTHLMLTVTDTIDGDAYGQSQRNVAADGSFESETFTAGDGFKDGIYVVEVLMPLLSLQPDHVKNFSAKTARN